MATATVVDEKALALVKREVSAVEKLAESVTVTSPQQLIAATDVLSRIKTAQKNLKTRMEAITKPLNAAMKEVRGLFAPFDAQLNRAESLIKGEILAFKMLEDERVAAEQEAIRVAEAKKRLTTPVAIKKLAAIVPAPATQVQSDRGAVQFRTVRVVEIVDSTLLPREYLIPDLARIRTAALAGTIIAGVAVREETQVAAR